VVFVEQLGFERLVAGEGFFDDCERGVSRTNFLDLDLFAFELLVVLEKTAKDEKAVRVALQIFYISFARY